ncbi:hypothetical protein WMY93_013446 [Mugilogobius chulae]|uniref:PLAT domain-containing protein n=1 Tax=Mugilogobius chulae TaxID=88201 RepID=A0AAW0NZI3_9GOBI
MALFEKVFEIFRTVSLKIGAENPNLYVISHPDGTLYQKKYSASDIGQATLGSKENGEYVVMPSQAALGPFLSDKTDIVAQVTTFRNNPHPTGEPLNGYIFSLVLNDGSSDNEIKVSNLKDRFEVGPKSTPDITQCLCDHLTLFGSSFFVMPNYVDLSRTAELFSTISQNFVVLALICTFYGCYFMTLLWACYADRKASSKRKITLLEGNHPGSQYNYLVCVHTGHRKNSGTTANVMAKLIGAEGESDTYNLTDPDKPVFERGSVDVFLLATPYPLGELKNLRLQHDNSGGGHLGT